MARYDQDVRWDHGAAAEAMAALRRTAADIEQAVADRDRMAGVAAQFWMGTHATGFGLQRSMLSAEARALAADCRAAASAIADADQRARAEQARREREREEREREEREARGRRDHAQS